VNETLILASVFTAVLIAAFATLSAVLRRRAINRNFEASGIEAPPSTAALDRKIFANENATIQHYFDVQQKGNPDSLEMRLIRAGYFEKGALPVYMMIRLVVTALAALATWWVLLSFVAVANSAVAILGGAVVGGVVFILCNIVLESREKAAQTTYRKLFPDFMDLLIVCVDAGLSIEAAIDRVAREFVQTKPAFGYNLAIISLEIRAGRPLHDALTNFSTRVGLEEAKTLATLFRQSQELGASVIKTLRVFSKEMRQTRLIRAEEKANALPIKMLFPLAGFMFPVNLIIVLVPIMIQIVKLFTTMAPGGGGI
jgi:tight adherence protein C